MIKINRPAKVPSRLSNEGATETRKNKKAYDEDTVKFISGIEKMKIFNNIYGHTEVKSVLKKAQHNKCCFCEKDQIEEYGAVEHFRPKQGFKINRKDKALSKPGYYWLAYDWRNLFYVCSFCNGVDNKGNLFPLVNETMRAKSHHDNINIENPYLINPAEIDPSDHIYFDDQIAKGKTVHGNKTIFICGLNRETLIDKRKNLIDNLNARIVIIHKKDVMEPEKVAEARAYLKKAILPAAEFSATAIDYLKQFRI